jgi:hypothetical protein
MCSSVIGAVAAALAPFLPGTATRIQTALADPSGATPVLFTKERRHQGNRDTHGRTISADFTAPRAPLSPIPIG